MVCAATARRSLPNASRLASAVARRVVFCVSREAGGLDINTVTQRYPRPGRHHPRRRVIQYSSTFVMESRSRGVLDTPLSRSMTALVSRPSGKKPAAKRKCEAAMAVGALDPGVPYESRWAPCDRIHGPGQGQFPEGSIRPRGYMAPDARRSFAPPM